MTISVRGQTQFNLSHLLSAMHTGLHVTNRKLTQCSHHIDLGITCSKLGHITTFYPST